MSSMANLMKSTSGRPQGPQSKEEFGTMIREFGNPFDKATWANKPKPTFGKEQAQTLGNILTGKGWG